MQIEFACPFCRKPHSVGPELAGRRGRCKDCGTVMRIPGERPAGLVEGANAHEPSAARVAAAVKTASVPTPIPRPRQQPAPIPKPEPMAEVEDPYGLADDLPAPTPRQGLVDAGVAEPGDAPLPRAGFEPSATRKRKRNDEGPWGLEIRQAAMGVMVVVGLLGRVSRGLRRSGQLDALSYVSTGVVGLCCLAALLSVISVAGAAVSLSRGNRLAFSAESGRWQLGWFATIALSFFGLYVALFGLPGADHAVLTSWDSKLSATEQADIGVYERLIASTVSFHERLASSLQTLPPPDAPNGREAWTALGELVEAADRLKSEAGSTPMPTRGQVKQLFDRHHGPMLAAIGRTTRTSRDVIARLKLPDDSDFGRMLNELLSNSVKYENGYKQVYPAGSTDCAGWYFAVFGADIAPGR